MTTGTRLLVVASAWSMVLACGRPSGDPAGLGPPEVIARGVNLYRTGDPALIEHHGPIAVWLLSVDPAVARIESVLSNDEVLDAETVESMAVRRGAVAAINGGYFNRDTGEPTGLLKIGGELVSDASMPRGAVVLPGNAFVPITLIFDRLAAKVAMSFSAGGRSWQLPIDGVDTTRARSRLMLYTPAYHVNTDTAPNGTEWVLEGVPLRVRDVRHHEGKTPIPDHGAVLSFGGTTLPPALAALVEGTEVSFATTWKTAYAVPDDVLNNARDIINGAGLLRRDGRAVSEWQSEGLNTESFVDARHPRSLIGLDRRGFIWLIAVDGRQPDYSVGMTFADLERLCARLELIGALNLDGGGSTTMVAKGHVVNRPSDLTGPRPVSDAIVVTMK